MMRGSPSNRLDALLSHMQGLCKRGNLMLNMNSLRLVSGAHRLYEGREYIRAAP